MLKWVIILSAAIVPAVLYSIYIRNIEKWNREPWRWVGVAYLWGGIAAGIFLTLTFLIYGNIQREHEYFRFFTSLKNILIIVVVFPFIGEAVKGIGLLFVKKELDEVEDGLIHGAICGLAFGSFVNIAYMSLAFTWKTEPIAGYQVPSMAFVIIASISTLLLHGSATAATGYGLSEALVDLDYLHAALYFLAGVLIHLLFNLLNVVTIYLEFESGLYALIGLAGVMLISMLVFRTIRARLLELIRILDHETYRMSR